VGLPVDGRVHRRRGCSGRGKTVRLHRLRSEDTGPKNAVGSNVRRGRGRGGRRRRRLGAGRRTQREQRPQRQAADPAKRTRRGLLHAPCRRSRRMRGSCAQPRRRKHYASHVWEGSVRAMSVLGGHRLPQRPRPRRTAVTGSAYGRIHSSGTTLMTAWAKPLGHWPSEC